MTTSTFTDEVKEMWRTRPLRTPWNSPIAGVSSGIGIRYGIDPTLVRVAFIAATIFGGAGVPLYLAAWLTFPRAGDEVSALESLAGKGRSSESSVKTIVLIVAFAIAFSAFAPFGIGLGGSGIISLGLMLIAVWLLHQRRPVPPAPPAPPTFATPSTNPSAGPPVQYQTMQIPDDEALTEKISAEQAPPSWDPLGAAPFAWDLPEPHTAPQKVVKPPRSPFTKVVLGLAIIAGALAAAAAYAGGDWFTAARVGAIVLTVIGGGLLIGALVNRGHGLILWAIPVIIFVTAASNVGQIKFDEPTGEQVWKVTSMDQLERDYNVQMGSGVLDLTDLVLTKNETVDIKLRFGDVKVLLPKNMDVKNDCKVEFGHAQCLPSGVNGGEDGANGPVLTLNIDGKFGEVKVDRE
ncbi:PspC domain-containing protein [Smaragdicoccus niigatensis]|uniref:PspC domain-containing protein n=1 Tax=Smaragdicoccus niigatensis TaxID=359359 RepID=UPI000477AAB7|nr:PspC domain-containing protein [Smaragdicoccus niigatensis]